MHNHERLSEDDPRRRTRKIEGMLTVMLKELREEADQVADVNLLKSFMATSRSLGTPVRAYEAYENEYEVTLRDRLSE